MKRSGFWHVTRSIMQIFILVNNNTNKNDDYNNDNTIINKGDDDTKVLTHWGRATHICVGKLSTIGSDNGLSPGQAPSHYLIHCWNNVNWTLGNKLQWNFNRNSNIFIQGNAFENVVCEMASILSRPQCVLTILKIQQITIINHKSSNEEF